MRTVADCNAEIDSLNIFPLFQLHRALLAFGSVCRVWSIATLRADHANAFAQQKRRDGRTASCRAICAWCHGEEPAPEQGHSNGSPPNEGTRADETGPCRGCALCDRRFQQLSRSKHVYHAQHTGHAQRAHRWPAMKSQSDSIWYATLCGAAAVAQLRTRPPSSAHTQG